MALVPIACTVVCTGHLLIATSMFICKIVADGLKFSRAFRAGNRKIINNRTGKIKKFKSESDAIYFGLSYCLRDNYIESYLFPFYVIGWVLKTIIKNT